MGDGGFDHAGIGASVHGEFKRVVTVVGLYMGDCFVLTWRETTLAEE